MGGPLVKRWHFVGRLLAGCVVGAVVIGFVAVGRAAAVKSSCPRSSGVWAVGAWTMLARPLGLADLRGAAIDVDHPDTVYVTDGRRIARSTSGGCSWRLVLDLADRGASKNGLAGAEITGLVAPPGPGRVYATVAIAPPFITTSIEPVLVSFDGGRSWQTSSGLPPLRPSRLRASPANPDVMYLSMHTGQSTASANSVDVGDIWSFYSSTDGGRSWTRRSAGQNRARFVPDPTEPRVVWSLGSETSASAGPYRSADGGVTWHATPGQPTNDQEDADLDVLRSPRRPAGIVIAQRADARQQGPPTSVYLSTDEGRTFRALPTAGLAGRVSSVAFGRTSKEIVISLDSGIYRFLDGTREWRDVDSLNLAPLMEGTRIRRAQPSWWFWRPELVAVYREPVPLEAAPHRSVIAPPPIACPASREFSPARVTRPPPASLEAVDEPIALEPSLSSRADFRLSLPAVPTRLDTYFLLDTSTSMGTAIDGVVCGLEQLVDHLARAGVDAQFGLGEFQDADGLRYRRVVDIEPPGFDLQNALRTRALAGGEEPHRGALYQTATGAGLRDATGRQLIRPRQAATYRSNALRVVLMVTDEPYQETTTYEPTLPQVLGALRARNIHHIGIHVRSGADSPAVTARDNALTRQQLDEFSRGTRTFAPAGGVDCDGDGSADLPPGAPLVCTVPRSGIEANLAHTLTALLLAVRQDGVVSLRPLRTDGIRVDVPSGQPIDVHGEHTGRSALVLPADITCTTRQAGTRHTLVMAADVSGVQVAQTPFRVTCGGVPPPPAVDRNPVAALHAPPPLAPAAVPATQPALSGSVSTSAAANPGSAPAAAPHGAITGAAVLAPDEAEPGVEPTSHRFTDAAAAARVAGAGALLGGFGVIERRRRSTRGAFSKLGGRR